MLLPSSQLGALARVALFAALGGSAACMLPGLGGGETAGSGGSGSGSGGGDAEEEASACEGASASCDDCFACAAQGTCSQLVAACRNDAACNAIEECLYICSGDPECSQQCYAQAPEGADLHNQTYACLYCAECPNDCAGRVTCQ